MSLWRMPLYLAVFYATGVAALAWSSSASLLPSAAALLLSLAPVCLLGWADTPVRLPPLVADFAIRKKLRPRGLSTMLSMLLVPAYALLLLKPHLGRPQAEVRAHRVDAIFDNTPDAWFSAKQGLDVIRHAHSSRDDAGRCYIMLTGMDGIEVLRGEVQPGEEVAAHEPPAILVSPDPQSNDVELLAFGRKICWQLPPPELHVRGLERQRHELEAAGFQMSEQAGFDVSGFSVAEDRTGAENKWYGVRLYSTSGSEPSLSRNLLMGFAKSSPGKLSAPLLWALGQDLSIEPFLVCQTDSSGLPRLVFARESGEPHDVFGTKGCSIGPRLRFETIAHEWRSEAYKSADDIILHDNSDWFKVSPWAWVFRFDIDRSEPHKWVPSTFGWLAGCLLLLAKARQC